MKKILICICLVSLLLMCACSSMYYNTMEKFGYPKRDILVDRVEAAADAQASAQEQFQSALDQFTSVVQVENTELKQAYEKLNDAYENSRQSAQRVSSRIDSVESVADALFDEWEDELDRYQSPELKRISARRLEETRVQYRKMLSSMRRAEKSMQPVLEKFEDNVLFLKHNLNAQAIGSLKTEFSGLKGDIADLIDQMNTSIETSNAFISSLQQK